MNNWLRENLACPRDKKKIHDKENYLICSENHSYPVIDDVPVMLLDEIEPNLHYITETLTDVAGANFLAAADATNGEEKLIDAFVQDEVPHTCGDPYFPIRYKLNRNPIPELRLPDSIYLESINRKN